MQKFSNRVTQPHLVSHVSRTEDDQFVLFTTNIGTYMVPATPLTVNMYEDDQYPYVLEFFGPTNVLTGITAPDDRTLFRINDSQAQVLSRTPVFASQMFKNGVPLPLDQTLPLLLEEVDPPFMERLKVLPEEYLVDYYVYETKVSYLASRPNKPYIFDATPNEMMHAMSLQFVDPITVPGFLL